MVVKTWVPSQHRMSQAWCNMPAVLALGREKLEHQNQRLKIMFSSSSSVSGSKPAWAP